MPVQFPRGPLHRIKAHTLPAAANPTQALTWQDPGCSKYGKQNGDPKARAWHLVPSEGSCGFWVVSRGRTFPEWWSFLFCHCCVSLTTLQKRLPLAEPLVMMPPAPTRSCSPKAMMSSLMFSEHQKPREALEDETKKRIQGKNNCKAGHRKLKNRQEGGSWGASA